MKAIDVVGQEIERMQRAAMGPINILRQVEEAQKMMTLNSGYSIAQDFLNLDNQWKKEIEQITRPFQSMNYVAHDKAAIEKMTGAKAFLENAKSWSETARIAAVSAMNSSLEGIASKIVMEFEASQRPISVPLGLSASQALASSLVNDAITGRGYYSSPTIGQILRQDASIFSKGLQASFSLAQATGINGIEKALAASLGSIASQYADQFDLTSRLRKMVEEMSTLDLATTASLARFHGVEGLASQMAAFGFEPHEFIDEETESQRTQVRSHSTTQSLSEISLEVFQQLLINLIAAYIWALFIAPTIPNPDLDAQNKKIAKIELLIEKLPQVIESRVEEIIRQQLLTDNSYFVVRERTARIRSSPDDGSSIVALAFPNQKLKVLTERGKWIKVEFYDYLGQSTREGWVLKKYCSRLPPSDTTR